MAQNEIHKIITIEFKNSELIDKMREAQNAIKALNTETKYLKEDLNEYRQQLKSGAISQDQFDRMMIKTKNEIIKNDQAVIKYKSDIKAYTRELQSNIRQDKEKIGSLNQLRASVKSLTAEYNNLSAAERGGVRGKEIVRQIQKTTAEIARQENALRNYHIGVGNYAGGIQKAFVKIGAAWMAIRSAFSLFRNSFTTIKDYEQANTNLGTILGATKEEMDKLLASLKDKEYEINEVKKGERIKNAPLPFTTSTLQQEAAKTLNFSTQKTMRLAQQLYEGIDIKGNGTVGVISYLRTDSTRISEEADAAAREYITAQYGEDYVSKSEKAVKKGQKIQDAHEAIRPTDISRTPAVLKESLSRDQFRLYQLIWRRFAASRMAPAKYETTSVKIGADQYIFTVSASKIIFDGFMSVYTDEEDQKKGNVLNQSLERGMKLSLKELKPEQHFTQPPAHYTEASLVKTMEELGIGRPSTYAPTITTIISRRYVAKEQKNLYVTELGEVVNNIMKQAFPSIVDVNFTATMEGLLDCVAAGTVKWKTVVSNFYPDLKKDVDAAEEELEKVDIQDEVTDVICENCGRHMVIKYGPHGRFLACPGFPECKNTKPYFEKIGVACPKCGKEIVLKKTKKGRKYYGCEDNPDCDFMSWQKPSAKKCPKCGSYMVEKGNKLVCSQETCGYVEAKDEKE